MVDSCQKTTPCPRHFLSLYASCQQELKATYDLHVSTSDAMSVAAIKAAKSTPAVAEDTAAAVDDAIMAAEEGEEETPRADDPEPVDVS